MSSTAFLRSQLSDLHAHAVPLEMFDDQSSKPFRELQNTAFDSNIVAHEAKQTVASCTRKFCQSMILCVLSYQAMRFDSVHRAVIGTSWVLGMRRHAIVGITAQL